MISYRLAEYSDDLADQIAVLLLNRQHATMLNLLFQRTKPPLTIRTQLL